MPAGSGSCLPAHSVCITPISGSSVSRANPCAVQKSRSLGQVSSGFIATTSRRWSPSRSILAFSISGRTAGAARVPVLPSPLAYCEYVASTPGICSESRIDELVRSGGTSSGGALLLDL